MSDLRHEFDDEDITWYLQVYKDARDAAVCLEGLRRHYPRSRVIMISDGRDDQRFPVIAERFGAEYTAGERLFGLQHGGRMIHRMLGAFLAKPSDYLIKIDPDTRVHRRFRCLPAGCIVFGTLEWQTAVFLENLDFPAVQGGCIGFTLEAVQRICESGILLSDELLDYRATYADTPDIISRAETTGLISDDYMMRYVCRKLGIAPTELDEVHSLYRGTIAPDGEGYAVTHPHKIRRPLAWIRDPLHGFEKRIRRTVRRSWAESRKPNERG